MRKDATESGQRAADPLARRIQEMDANLDLNSAAEAGCASHEILARFQGLRQNLLNEFRPLSLHEQIVAASITTGIWSQRRYPAFESGLLDAYIRDQWDQAAPDSREADPDRRLLRAFHSFTAHEQTTHQTMGSIQHRLHVTTRANAERLLQARRLRAASKRKAARISAREAASQER
ncbi:hypothetical protein [uncultured Paludibaculum sp.]|uniref:hypothetical protein n=1 Tax=uncultured Paludibaculum sp. TaxID=1765020 RepID=UPI002AAAE06A|nr:hypothetical protein [uncultured Paludibaculum sp.]